MPKPLKEKFSDSNNSPHFNVPVTKNRLPVSADTDFLDDDRKYGDGSSCCIYRN